MKSDHKQMGDKIWYYVMNNRDLLYSRNLIGCNKKTRTNEPDVIKGKVKTGMAAVEFSRDLDQKQNIDSDFARK
ncbi:ATP-dependent DNA helicase pcrA [Dorcoceras hygrometricum]|uniref:ATP-dependent DNA helicase pcrA n=2 Tax=Dorcoceras hygrometricum TaxID=472368 RepID=A0A2Z6ZQF6_9LAMI|nr:ATP-dependent DNA helicase pcrA [Dorcoceras hygrometricum]